MFEYEQRQLPEYYPTMYLDGYTPEEIWIAHHKTMLNQLAEKQSEDEAIKNINLTSEIKIK